MQQTFAEASFEQYRKSTRRERFLDEMNRVVPWAELVAVIEPVYPKAEGPGRPPVGIERMLRVLCLQQWFNLSDPAVEEALYDSRAMRQFAQQEPLKSLIAAEIHPIEDVSGYLVHAHLRLGALLGELLPEEHAHAFGEGAAVEVVAAVGEGVVVFCTLHSRAFIQGPVAFGGRSYHAPVCSRIDPERIESVQRVRGAGEEEHDLGLQRTHASAQLLELLLIHVSPRKVV